MSAALFQDGQKDEACFWFYAGQLRARFDANRCPDETAAGAVGVLTEAFGPQINQYAFRNKAKLEKTVLRVIEWDRKTPHSYDHRWIDSHGMDAVLGAIGVEEGKPAATKRGKGQWEKIAEKTRCDYLEGFDDALVRRASAARKQFFEEPEGRRLGGGRGRGKRERD